MLAGVQHRSVEHAATVLRHEDQMNAKRGNDVSATAVILAVCHRPTICSGIVKVRYRYRIYPSPGQQQALARVFGCARVVYNDCLRVRDEACAAGEKIADTEVQRRVITLAKLTPERVWLGEVASVALVQACQDARRAYKNWYDSLAGRRKGRQIRHPKPRRKHGRQSVRLTRNGFALHRQRLYVAKVGDLRVEWSRDLPSVPSSVTVIREPDGRYYASFVVERQATPLPACNREVGIDLGLNSLVVTSDGEVIANPRFLRAAERRLIRAQRVLSRRQKGSANRAMARRRVAAMHRKVRETRHDHMHKVALRLVRDNQAGLRRRSVRVRHGPHPAGQVNIRCWLVATAAVHRGESGPVWPHLRRDRPFRADEPCLLDLRGEGRPEAAQRPHLDLRGLRDSPRPRCERSKEHIGGRAGRQSKRLI